MTKKTKRKQTISSLEPPDLLRIPLCKLCSAYLTWGMVLTLQHLSKTLPPGSSQPRFWEALLRRM